MKAGKKEYQIGPWSVWMTDEQAHRFNHQQTTAEDERDIIVCVPSSNRGLPTHEEISMSDAMSYESFLECVDELDGDDLKPI